jgi:hypothetical protein
VCGLCGRQKKKWEKVEGKTDQKKNQSRWRSSAMGSLYQEDLSQGRNVCKMPSCLSERRACLVAKESKTEVWCWFTHAVHQSDLYPVIRVAHGAVFS